MLNDMLDQVKCSCEGLRRCLGGSERANIMRLEVSVLEMFLLMDGLKDTPLEWPRDPITYISYLFNLTETIDNVTQVYEEYEKTLADLEKMKIRLSFYRGT